MLVPERQEGVTLLGLRQQPTWDGSSHTCRSPQSESSPPGPAWESRPWDVPVSNPARVSGEPLDAVSRRKTWAADVGAALGQLDPFQRRLIVLSYFHAKTQADISVELALPIATVRAVIADGLRRCAAILMEEHAMHDQALRVRSDGEHA
jgi:DNA-directed RNA polymerase specialized sigma24 family protein